MFSLTQIFVIFVVDFLVKKLLIINNGIMYDSCLGREKRYRQKQ